MNLPKELCGLRTCHHNEDGRVCPKKVVDFAIYFQPVCVIRLKTKILTTNLEKLDILGIFPDGNGYGKRSNWVRSGARRSSDAVLLNRGQIWP